MITRLTQPSIFNPIWVGPQIYTVGIVVRLWMLWVYNGQARMKLQNLDNKLRL